MDYNLLICISSDKLMALDVKDGKHIDRVSMDGNDSMKITSDRSIADFCSQILIEYNIGSFSELDMHISIISVNAKPDNVVMLFECIRGVSRVSILDARTLFPILILKKKAIQANSIFKVHCFENSFLMEMKSNFEIDYLGEGSGEEILIEPEQFSIVFFFDCQGLISNDDEIRNLEKKYKDILKKKDEEIKKKDDEIKKIEEKYNKLEKQYQQQQKEMDILKRERDDEEKALGSKREVVWYKKCDIGFSSLLGSIFGDSNRIKNVYKDGEKVKKGADIAVVYRSISADSRDTKKLTSIQASKAGRIFYLIKDDSLTTDDVAVAVIAEPSDTRDRVMKWFKNTIQ